MELGAGTWIFSITLPNTALPPTRVFPDMVALDLPKPEKVETPLLVLGTAGDNLIDPGEIEATARAYHTRYEIIPNVAHDSMFELRCQVTAERILAWLDRQQMQTALSVLAPDTTYQATE